MRKKLYEIVSDNILKEQPILKNLRPSAAALANRINDSSLMATIKGNAESIKDTALLQGGLASLPFLKNKIIELYRKFSPTDVWKYIRKKCPTAIGPKGKGGTEDCIQRAKLEFYQELQGTIEKEISKCGGSSEECNKLNKLLRKAKIETRMAEYDLKEYFDLSLKYGPEALTEQPFNSMVGNMAYQMTIGNISYDVMNRLMNPVYNALAQLTSKAERACKDRTGALKDVCKAQFKYNEMKKQQSVLSSIYNNCVRKNKGNPKSCMKAKTKMDEITNKMAALSGDVDLVSQGARDALAYQYANQ